MNWKFGYPPRDDVAGAVKVLMRYREAGLMNQERAEMSLLHVNDPKAVLEGLAAAVAVRTDLPPVELEF